MLDLAARVNFKLSLVGFGCGFRYVNLREDRSEGEVRKKFALMFVRVAKYKWGSW